MKFADFEFFREIFERNAGDTEKIFREVTREYIKKHGNDSQLDTKTEFVVKAADAVAPMEDPSVKIKKATRELDYDASMMDSLINSILPYMGQKKINTAFEIFWDVLKRALYRLSGENKEAFTVITDALKHKKVKIHLEKGIREGNIFDSIKNSLKISGPGVDSFLTEMYNLNVKMGNNPTGKGEYILDLFVVGAVKGSDVRIHDEQYEIKAVGAAVGESLGSKITYHDKLSSIYKEAGEKLEYEKMSFGKKIFRTTWAPEFVNFTVKHPESAADFLHYQYKFFTQEESNRFNTMVRHFVESPSPEKLSAIYDKLVIDYMKIALNVDGEKKSMIVFEEKKGAPTGRYLVFDFDSIDEVCSFTGSDKETPVKLQLPKSSATMRPEIESINFDLVKR